MKQAAAFVADLKARLPGLAKAVGAHAPALVRDSAGLVGVSLVAYGSWLVYRPAGYIVAGALLIVGALLAARGQPA